MASTDILLGRASQTDDFSEIFADYGMTAVLHGRGYNLAESGVFRDENENEPILVCFFYWPQRKLNMKKD